MLKKLVGMSLFIGLPGLLLTKALPNDVVVVAALLLSLTWLVLPAAKQSHVEPKQTEPMPQPAKVPVSEHQSSAVEQTDPFFGHLYNTQGENELYVSLHLACKLAASAPAAFIGHLNSLLRDLPDNSLVMIGDTSYPEFGKLLMGLPAEQIVRIDIAARTDMNPNVNATLECIIWLTSGVVRVRPQWCARSTNRADEIVNTLLLPLVAHKVMDRGFVVDGQGNRQHLPKNYSGVAEQVFRLAGYPEAANGEAYGRRLYHYSTQLEQADNR